MTVMGRRDGGKTKTGAGGEVRRCSCDKTKLRLGVKHTPQNSISGTRRRTWSLGSVLREETQMTHRLLPRMGDGDSEWLEEELGSSGGTSV